MASSIGLLVFSWLILLCIVISTLDTRKFGVFTQKRIGRNAKPFSVFKIRTMYVSKDVKSTITSSNDSRITPVGSLFRKLKLDELPQLFNVLRGDMSLVGPRPDVPGYADKLNGEDKEILDYRPGITGYATLLFKYEEEILEKSSNKEKFNDEVIFPLKVALNKTYMSKASIVTDLDLIFQTAIGKSFLGKKLKPFKTPRECLLEMKKYA
ncbi:sugar transferase [Ferrimonas sediminicola]|uniref:Sugar transferase n=2 Tax=Ferrimonas sediminicola TaxID=2569538 RepID=A0A4U1B7A4_9GAMM|nr:sugar transferase [Ferrimonas sediminicola]